jgi:DNA-binding XRE family transcriptional regulator
MTDKSYLLNVVFQPQEFDIVAAQKMRKLLMQYYDGGAIPKFDPKKIGVAANDNVNGSTDDKILMLLNLNELPVYDGTFHINSNSSDDFCAVFRKMLINVREQMTVIKSIIIGLQTEQGRILTRALSDGLTEELKAEGQDIEDTKRDFDWILKVLEEFEKSLEQKYNDADKSFQNSFNSCLGQNIRKVRKEKNLTIEELAKILDVVPMSLSTYERGKRCPPATVIYRLASRLNIDANRLFEFGEGVMTV